MDFRKIRLASYVILLILIICCIVVSAQKVICTDDIAFPDWHKGPEIECNADTNIKYPITPCKLLGNCVLTVKNCNPEGTTITRMLTSLTEPNSAKRIISPGNITHLILWVQKWKFKKKANPRGIDVSGAIFVDMDKHFTNLISITFWRDGFYGSITPETYIGLENVEVIRIDTTFIENIENGSFDNLKKIKGISISNNRKLNNLPSNIFAKAQSLESFRLHGNFGGNTHIELMRNLLDPLENLKHLRLVGTEHKSTLLSIPPHFLRNSCKKLNCIDLKYVHPNISNDLFANCDSLQHVYLHDNDLTLNQILDIEDQLLLHVNKLSYLEIKEKSLKCPICSKGKEKHCNCSDCTNIGKFNKLLGIAHKTDIHCYIETIEKNTIEKNATDTTTYFRDAEKHCDTCKTLKTHYGLIAFAVIVIIILGVIIGVLSRKKVRATLYSDPLTRSLFPNEQDGPVFIIHVDNDLKPFMLLKDTLEGNQTKVNRKRLGGRIYQTLYHERDFEPGEFISKNIKNCVDKSRRALIILTPSFLRSEWCREEYVIAQSQQKAVFIKMKLDEEEEKELNRLLALTENKPIKENLETRTYLKWTGKENDKEFWKWLAYLLPHKKSESSEGFLNILAKRICCRITRRQGNTNEVLDAEQPEGESLQINLIEPSNSNLNNLSEPPEQDAAARLRLDTLNIDETTTEDHENEEWFHPSFESLQDACKALYVRSSGTFLVTDLPESEKSFGLYGDDSYVLLLRGQTGNSSYVIRHQSNGYMISGTDHIFSSLRELISHFQDNSLPESEARLSETLGTCRRCRRCSSRDNGES